MTYLIYLSDQINTTGLVFARRLEGDYR